MNNLELGKKIKKHGIIEIITCCLIVGFLFAWILIIIDGIKILSTDWGNQQLNNDKTVWGIFTFVLLGPIAQIVWGNKVINQLGA